MRVYGITLFRYLNNKCYLRNKNLNNSYIVLLLKDMKRLFSTSFKSKMSNFASLKRNKKIGIVFESTSA